jgi:hypothetical protein
MLPGRTERNRRYRAPTHQPGLTADSGLTEDNLLINH